MLYFRIQSFVWAKERKNDDGGVKALMLSLERDRFRFKIVRLENHIIAKRNNKHMKLKFTRVDGEFR